MQDREIGFGFAAEVVHPMEFVAVFVGYFEGRVDLDFFFMATSKTQYRMVEVGPSAAARRELLANAVPCPF